MDAATGFVTTVAGTGSFGPLEDGGPATQARLNEPYAVAVDGLGNVFIADAGNDRIRRVDHASGLIGTIAGGGAKGVLGDGGPATSASLIRPTAVAIDGQGNVFIAEDLAHRVRVVAADTGIITTIAGTGLPGYAGDGGPATLAQLSLPQGLAVDPAGRLLIADSGNHVLRRVDRSSGIISTIAGTGLIGDTGDGGPALSAHLYFPGSVAVDGKGAITLTSGARVRRIDPTTGIITAVAGTGAVGFSGDGGSATAAMLGIPLGVAVDSGGSVFIADTGNHRVRRVDPATGTISTFAGDGSASQGESATSVPLRLPRALARDANGRIYVTDYDAHSVHRLDPASGLLTLVVGTGAPGFGGDGGPATLATLKSPSGVAVDAAGVLYIADKDNHRVRRVDLATGVITTLAGTDTAGFTGDGGPATAAQLNAPEGLALDTLGHLFIADTGNHRIRRVDLGTGLISTEVGSGCAGELPGCAASFGGDGGPATGALLNRPRGVVVDPQGGLYVLDTLNHRVRRVDADGRIATLAGTGGVGGALVDGSLATTTALSSPSHAAVDPVGDLVIADTNHHVLLRVERATGRVRRVAGTGVSTYAGDGGAATAAGLWAPSAVVVDSAGNVTFADSLNRRVRQVNAATKVITTLVGLSDPPGLGPVATARFSDPRALVVAPGLTLLAGGVTGTVQALRGDRVEVVVGRHLGLPMPTGDLARYRDERFGTVGGVAYDAAARTLYLTETSAERVHLVTLVDPAAPGTWTIAPLAGAAGEAGFADGPAGAARFREPSGLFLDPAARRLYVADAGNHAVRLIDLSGGPAAAAVSTVAGTPAERGFFGDGGPATGALLYRPEAVTRCPNGDLFIADTGNHRVRRVDAQTGLIATVLGDGVPASSGQGAPARLFPVDEPLGLACSAAGDLFVSSSAAVRLLPADAAGVVDGEGPVATIFGATPLPGADTRCLTGLAVVDPKTVQVTDACAGLLVELVLTPVP